MKERFKVIPAVYGMFLKDGRILLSRRFNTGYSDGQFSLPAGHVDAGESVFHGLVREMQEEVGVEIDLTATKLVHTRSRNAADGHRVDFFFAITKWNGELTNKEPEKCDLLEWFDVKNPPKEAIPYIADVLRAFQKNEPYSEEGWD